MGLTDLPPELRYSIYTFWFHGRTFKSTQFPFPPPSRYGLLAEGWLSDVFVICKSITCDPWLTLAVLRNATFHLRMADDLQNLRRRFGDVALQELTQISLSPMMSTDNTVVLHLQTLMPKLTHVHLVGTLTPMQGVWDYRLRNFDKHPWSQFIACLCIFAPAGVPGMDSLLTEWTLSGHVELVVDFEWEDPGLGRGRSMQFETRDWVVRWEFRGVSVSVKQVRPVELMGVLEGISVT